MAGEIIIFYILKILWLVLRISFFLILFVLFLLLVIILANIKYIFKSNTKVYEDSCYSQDFNFKMTYLFGIVRLYCDKKNDKIRILLRVFKKNVYRDVKYFSQLDDIIFKNQREEEAVKEESKPPQEPTVKTEPIKEEVPKKSVKAKTTETKEIKAEPKKVDSKEATVKADIEKDVTNENLDSEEVPNEEEINETNKKEISFFDTLKNKDTILKIFNAGTKTLKGLKPEKFNLKLKLGFEDPSITGQAVGACYAISGITGLEIEAEGEYNEEIKPEIQIFCKGRTSFFKLLSPFLFLGWYFIKFKLTTKFIKNKGE